MFNNWSSSVQKQRRTRRGGGVTPGNSSFLYVQILTLWQFSIFSTVITSGWTPRLEKTTVSQMIFPGPIFQLLPSLRGEQSCRDKVIRAWLSGEEMLMNPDKACRRLVWLAHRWRGDPITFHLTLINGLLELEENAPWLWSLDLLNMWCPEVIRKEGNVTFNCSVLWVCREINKSEYIFWSSVTSTGSVCQTVLSFLGQR